MLVWYDVGDVDSGDELRTYPFLRKILERKLERKKKRDNFEASRRALAGPGQGQGNTQVGPSGAQDRLK